ncbi:hypothetical protein RLOC_00005208 [Lonchura striata]|uniref:Uncharacterized protein n=1 Tax=Lonchura striata TaxID=40157 RepID=A0A218UH75_9PASE|nr:hypothetical protein RLOC_00005208 [Lonchura striata domestica]
MIPGEKRSIEIKILQLCQKGCDNTATGFPGTFWEKNMNSQPPRPDGFLQRELGACPQRSSGQRWCHRCGCARCFLGQKKEIKLTLHQAGI